MTHDHENPLDELRRADPARSRRPQPSDSKARVWARIQEVTMEPTSNPTASRRPIWAVGAAAIVAVAVAAVAVLVNAGGVTPPSPTDDPGTGIGSCVESYSVETLAEREVAFDGTVTAIDGDDVTFAVNEAFAGVDGDEITLTASGMTGTAITSAGGPTLAVGERYLVAGDGGFAWACGFTQPYDPGVAEDWAEATQ